MNPADKNQPPAGRERGTSPRSVYAFLFVGVSSGIVLVTLLASIVVA